MIDQLALLPGYLTAHLQLTLLALFIGVAFSVPAGVLITRIGWLEQPVLGVASVIQTVPSLALLAIMVPTLAALGLQSIGYLPAIIGLTLYSLLPILRNTVTGLAGVDPALIEAARGVGMTPRQRLWRVELPLAMPVIIAGIRTSTVLTVGVATLSTPVGATSLGNYIFSGLQTRNFSAVIVGCVAAAGLALVLDALIRGLSTGLQERRRPLVAVTTAALLLVGALAAAPLVAGAWRQQATPVRIGAKTFTEQYILSEIIAGLLNRETGRPVETIQSLGSTVAFDALHGGQIDVYVDYSGTLWATILRREVAALDRGEVLEDVRAALERDYGVEQVGALGFENTYALAVREANADARGFTRISDVIPYARSMAFGSDYEFFGRPEWAALEAAYGLEFAELRSMDASLMYQAVAQGDVDIISAFSTDGRIEVFDLRVLEDDRGAIPPYDAVVLARPGLADDLPDVHAALDRLVGTIDATDMRRMNLAVDEGNRTAGDVARDFVDGILGTARSDDP